MNDIVARDLNHNWHPYTRTGDYDRFPPIPVKRAIGVKLFDPEGNFYYDTISSWWCNVHGHGHPAIKRSIEDQFDKLDHVLFAGFTHEPAVELSERLMAMSPKGLSKVFYSDNGSTAVEVALKMSIQYWAENGQKGKTSFLSLDRGYHGDTVGAMSVSGPSSFNKAFEPLLFKSFKAETPYCYRCPAGKSREECSLDCLKSAEKLLADNAGRIAAFIIEPMLLGAGGMIVYPAEYLTKAHELSRKYNVHLIVDEVATGFGRTGKMFACEYAHIEPDFMCLSKGITSGCLPLGVTLITQKIFDPFSGLRGQDGVFYHGHTYTANPLACSAAVRSIDLFEEENTLENAKMVGSMLGAFLEKASIFPNIGDTRHIGTVGAMEIVKDKTTKEMFPEERRIGMDLYASGLRKGLILRPLGNIVYFFLPLCVKKDELEDIFERTFSVLTSTLGRIT